MQKKKSLAEIIVDSIPIGSRTKRPDSLQLAKKFGTSQRKIRKIIADARADGQVIIADHGYYIPDTQDEADRRKLEQVYHRERSRALSVFRGLKSTRKLIRQNESDEAMENMQKVADSLKGDR